MTRVRRVRGSKDLGAFIDLPYRLHRDDPLWVPPFRFDLRQRLSRKHNPFFEHGEADYFLAERDGRPVGRVAAIANRLHDETHGDGAAFFGFFESIDDAGVARALLDRARDWARERGYTCLRGPASFSTNDECGLLVHGFDSPPTLLMGHNPRHYPRLVEEAGGRKAKDLVVFAYDRRGGDASRPERLTRTMERVARRAGVEIRNVDRKQFDAEVDRLREGFNRFWEHNWGFVPMTRAEISHMARQLRPVYDPRLTAIAEKDGELAGIAFGMPDLHQVLRSNRRGRLFPAVLRLLWALRRKKISRMRVLLLGIVPELRGRGVDALLMERVWAGAEALGIDWCEAGWILEENAAMANAMIRLGFVHYKTYRMYDLTP